MPSYLSPHDRRTEEARRIRQARSHSEFARQVNLEGTGRTGRLFADLELANRMAPKPRIRKKKRVLLRPKKFRVVTTCQGCGNNLDRNGKIRFFSGNPYCKSCWTKTFYMCVRCHTNHRRGSQATIRICASCKEHMGSHDRPMEVSNIRWSKGSDIVGTTFDVVGSKRAFGLEIETQTCPWAERLEGKTPFGCKYDATVSGREFDSPILSGDEGLAVVLEFCDLAKSRGWKVNDNCGTHLHLNMRDEQDRNLKVLALAYLRTFPIWESLVQPHRLKNTYCGGVSYTAQQILSQSFQDFSYNQSRYQFVNCAAYQRYKTIEIRGLEGSLDKPLISNWIKAHLRFADYALTQSMAEIEQQFNRPESECWVQLRKHIGTGPARFWGRVRANRNSKLALE